MKKFLRYSFTILLIVSCAIVIPACKINDAITASTTTTTTTTTSAPTTTTTAPTTTTTTVPNTTTTTVPNPTKTSSTTLPSSGTKISFPDTLFIGDSRTVGLRDYGKLSDATFFCNVGLNSYKIWKESVEVPGVGTVTLDQLLTKKQFKQVYIMLGINELGSDLSTTAGKYQSLINGIREKQPNAKFIINSTLHVTKKCNDITSGSKKIFTNKRINDFNALIAALADNQTVFYLDFNPAFDDKNGHLSTDYAAGDGIHIKAKGYLVWRQYLDDHRIA